MYVKWLVLRHKCAFFTALYWKDWCRFCANNLQTQKST